MDPELDEAPPPGRPAAGPASGRGWNLPRVIAEARRLAAAEGIAELTMRSLSRRLGVAPNALYSYFADKDALLDELVDQILGEIENPPVDRGDWREGLAELMRRSRRLLLAHADLMPTFLARPTRGPNARRLGEATLALLARGGLSGQAAVDALRILLIYTMGFAAQEAPDGSTRIRPSGWRAARARSPPTRIAPTSAHSPARWPATPTTPPSRRDSPGCWPGSARPERHPLARPPKGCYRTYGFMFLRASTTTTTTHPQRRVGGRAREL